MRTIKFRAKSVEGHNIGEWVFGDLHIRSAFPHIHTDVGTRCKIDPNTIGQFTGLCDKNGKMVYEGDVLRLTIPDGSIRYFSVEWAEEKRTLMPLRGFEHDGNPVRISGWCFNWNGHRLYPSVIDGVFDNERMEIVGNIHENKINEN